MIREEHGIHCMPSSSRIMRKMLSEVQTMKKYYFHNNIIFLKSFHSVLYLKADNIAEDHIHTGIATRSTE